MLFNTKVGNNQPCALNTNVAAKHNFSSSANIIKDSSNRISAGYDLNLGLQLGSELSTGNLTVNKCYLITATETNYFGTGLVIGNKFVASATTALTSNNKVREVLGNHIVNTTTANMLIHSNRYNMLTYSEDLTNVAWIKYSAGSGILPVVTKDYGIAPNGTQTAQRVILDKGLGVDSTNQSQIYQPFTTATGARYSYGLWMKTNDGSTKIVSMDFGGMSGDEGNTKTITGEWKYYEVHTTAIDTARYPYLRLRGGFGTSDYADLLIWHPMFNIGSKAPPYQRINAATDYDTVGFPYYAQSDGVTQYLKSLPYTLNQPTTVMILCRQLSWADADYIYDGVNATSMFATQRNAVGNVRIGAGIILENATKSNIGTLDVITAQYNGANSFSKINTLAKVIGDTGSGNGGGFTLGASTAMANQSNLRIYDVVIIREALSDISVSQIMNYWKGKYKDYIDW